MIDVDRFYGIEIVSIDMISSVIEIISCLDQVKKLVHKIHTTEIMNIIAISDELINNNDWKIRILIKF